MQELKGLLKEQETCLLFGGGPQGFVRVCHLSGHQTDENRYQVSTMAAKMITKIIFENNLLCNRTNKKITGRKSCSGCAWCWYTRGRFESTHGGFLDGHTGGEEGGGGRGEGGRSPSVLLT